MIPAWMLAMLLTAPTAIVDSVHGVDRLAPLQMLMPGERFELGQSGRVRLAYFASCVHETVRGGSLRVGVTASLDGGGIVERVTADCNPPALAVDALHAPAALVLRDGDAGPEQAPPRRLRTRTPVLVTRSRARVRMVRVTPPGRSLFLPARDGIFDFAEHRLALGTGETWRACTGGRCVRIWVDPHATHSRGPVLERVIVLH